jgi:hypothetical protein
VRPSNLLGGLLGGVLACLGGDRIRCELLLAGDGVLRKLLLDLDLLLSAKRGDGNLKRGGETPCLSEAGDGIRCAMRAENGEEGRSEYSYGALCSCRLRGGEGRRWRCCCCA